MLLGAGVRVLTLLLQGGANPLQLDKEGHSALHLAALGGRQDAAALLARHGGDLRAKSRHGHSARELGRCWPLSLAVGTPAKSSVQFLRFTFGLLEVDFGLQDGANKGGVDATLAVATAASTMLKKRAARRKQEELDEQV